MSESTGNHAAASVRQRLLNRSRETGEDYNLLLTRYGNERLLYRLSVSPHAGRFVLKGALLFAAWTGVPHRPTRDLDLLGRGDPSPDALAGVFRELCDLPVDRDDGLRLDAGGVLAREIREGREYGGVRVTLLGLLGNARVPLQVDVGFGDAITPGPVTLTYPTLLADSPPPVLAAYPPETVVAEKLQAMVDLGLANTRMKDFYDAWLLLRDFDLDDAVLAEAVRATFARRGTPLPSSTPLALTAAFADDGAKRRQWASFLAKSGVADAPVGLAEVVDYLRRRLLPLLGVE